MQHSLGFEHAKSEFGHWYTSWELCPGASWRLEFEFLGRNAEVGWISGHDSGDESRLSLYPSHQALNGPVQQILHCETLPFAGHTTTRTKYFSAIQGLLYPCELPRHME